MGYFDAITSGSFKTAPDGRQLFFPWGVIGHGYVIPTDAEYHRLRRQTKIYTAVSLALIIAVAMMQHFLWTLGVGGVLMAAYAAWAYVQMRRLQPTGELERALVAGPYHPAFGELVMARLMLQQTRRRLAGVAAEHPVTLVIAERDRSVFQGQRGANLWRLRQLGLDRRFVLRTDPHLPRQTVLVIAGRRHDLGRV